MVDLTNNFIVQPGICLFIDTYGVEVESYWGNCLGVYYFQVAICDLDLLPEPKNNGLLRIDPNNFLQKENDIRQQIKSHRMLPNFLITEKIEEISIKLTEFSSRVITELPITESVPQVQTLTANNDLDNSNSEDEDNDFLEELYFSKPNALIKLTEVNIYLSRFSEELSLKTWLQQEKSLDEILTNIIQFCQFACYLGKKNWYFGQINPQLIGINKPIKFYDLIGLFDAHTQYRGLSGAYCPPELMWGEPVNEQMSSYLVGLLLYESIHNCLPTDRLDTDFYIKPIPGICQLLLCCLSASGDRPSLEEILTTLIEIQQSRRKPVIYWQTAGQSTIGLGKSRLHNEDNYGISQRYLSGSNESMVLGVLADGMGGMEQGEVASKLAVKAIVETAIPPVYKEITWWNDWLLDLVYKANQEIFKSVRNGGTTCSAILAIGKDLAIAHIGDSRIFLIRQGRICQLSEDHSLVSKLLASGEIDYETSLDHPDHNILTRSLGTEYLIQTNKIQTLYHYGDNYKLELQNNDILLICSDGIWDLIESYELCDLFTESISLGKTVNYIIELVIARGASDNGTIIAFKCEIPEIITYS